MNLMWVAHYDNGDCLPQYDPETKKENMWSDVDKTRLVKLGYYPYNSDFQIIPIMSFELDIKEGFKPIIFRRNSITVNVREEDKFGTEYILGYENGDGVKHLIGISDIGKVRIFTE